MVLVVIFDNDKAHTPDKGGETEDKGHNISQRKTAQRPPFGETHERKERG